MVSAPTICSRYRSVERASVPQLGTMGVDLARFVYIALIAVIIALIALGVLFRRRVAIIVGVVLLLLLAWLVISGRFLRQVPSLPLDLMRHWASRQPGEPRHCGCLVLATV